jgi:hypothetical protein
MSKSWLGRCVPLKWTFRASKMPSFVLKANQKEEKKPVFSSVKVVQNNMVASIEMNLSLMNSDNARSNLVPL